MSIYRRKRSTGKRSRYYTAEFMFRGQLYRRSGFTDRDHARDWMATESLRLRRGETGYIKPMLRAEVMPLIERFTDSLRAKGRSAKYIETARNRLRRLAGECGWRVLGDMTADSLEQWKGAESRQERTKRLAGDRTKNQFIQVAAQFGKWLWRKEKKLPNNPLDGIELLRAKHNDRYRRAATIEEIDKLLGACSTERRLYYLTRIYTPMRGGTYAKLTWRMAHLDAAPPFFATPAAINKSRRDEKHVIRYEIAQQLRAKKKRSKAKVDALVFPNAPTLADLKADLAMAGVDFDDGKGNSRLDFHAFRRTLIRLAKRAGVSKDDASLLLAHRDPRTTAKYYDEDTVDPDLGTMIEKLPTLGQIRRAQ